MQARENTRPIIAFNRFRGKEQMPRGPRTNRKIRITPIRVIGPQGQQIGIMETADALSLAEEQSLDLVEIQPDSRPPVCKIMDYGKHKYDQSKKANRSRAAARASGGDLKEVRLGRSVKIDPNDVRVRVAQARKFLMKMDKVQLTQRFRGREIVHKDLGLQRLQEIADSLADISKIESAPRWNGRSASIILAPDRARISAQRDRETSLALNAKRKEEELTSANAEGETDKKPTNEAPPVEVAKTEEAAASPVEAAKTEEAAAPPVEVAKTEEAEAPPAKAATAKKAKAAPAKAATAKKTKAASAKAATAKKTKAAPVEAAKTEETEASQDG
jgi:translation initiation factor IF-3